MCHDRFQENLYPTAIKSVNGLTWKAIKRKAGDIKHWSVWLYFYKLNIFKKDFIKEKDLNWWKKKLKNIFRFLPLDLRTVEFNYYKFWIKYLINFKFVLSKTQKILTSTFFNTAHYSILRSPKLFKYYIVEI